MTKVVLTTEAVLMIQAMRRKQDGRVLMFLTTISEPQSNLIIITEETLNKVQAECGIRRDILRKCVQRLIKGDWIQKIDRKLKLNSKFIQITD